VQIIVYVGGITVLIIFSIFLTQQAGELLPAQKIGRQVFAAAAVFCSFALVMLQVYKNHFTPTTEAAVSPVITNIGTQMLSVEEGGYALPFELVSMLLLAALIGCIVIAMRSDNSLPEPSQNLN
jgi:NADH-quinone oxidoreductase subunit J